MCFCTFSNFHFLFTFLADVTSLHPGPSSLLSPPSPFPPVLVVTFLLTHAQSVLYIIHILCLTFFPPLITSHIHVPLFHGFCSLLDLRAPCGWIPVLCAELCLCGAPGLQDPGGVSRQEGRGEQTQPSSVSQLQRGPENQIPIFQSTLLKPDKKLPQLK